MALILSWNESLHQTRHETDIRSVSAHGPRGSMTRDPAQAAGTALDIVTMAALLLAPIGTGVRASNVLSRTVADSGVFNVDNGQELLAQVATTLRDAGDQEALVNLLEFVSTQSHLVGTMGEAVVLFAATNGPLDGERVERVASVLRRRAKDLRERDPELSARYLFNAGQTLLHNHQRAEGLACFDELESFSNLYVTEPQFFKARGQGRWWTGNLEGAVADYQKAWELGLRSPGLVDNLSDALMTAGQYTDALEIARSSAEGSEVDDTVVLRRVVLRDAIALTGLDAQKREVVDAAECDDLSGSGDASVVRDFLVKRDALAPTLMIRLGALEGESQTGGYILLATWNEEFAPLWGTALMTAVAEGEDREVLEALARRGVTASKDFLQVVGEIFADARTNVPDDADWDELESWVYTAAASANPFRKSGLIPLNGPIQE